MRDLSRFTLPLMVAWLLAGCGGGNDGASSRGGSAPGTPLALQLSGASVSAPEGGVAVSVGVRLSAAPSQTLSLSVEKVNGDPDINLVGSPVVSFTTENWRIEQPIDIEAAQDPDRLNSTATFRFSATGATPVELVVVESDDDQQVDSGLVRVDVASVQVNEGNRATLRVRLVEAPSGPVILNAETTLETLRVVDGGTLRFDADNWSRDQSLVLAAARDSDACNAKGLVRLSREGSEQRVLSATIIDADRPEAASTLVCGTFSAPEAAVIDSDVNDPEAPYESNDQPTRAQQVINPVTIGGYVNVAGSGVPGRSMVAGDPSDFYVADFVAGQSVVLHVASSQDADLDLFLYDASGVLQDVSAGAGDVEAVTVGANGRYWVEVYACSTTDGCAVNGGSNYLLTLGQTNPLPNIQTLTLTGAFIPGEIVARWRDATTVSRALSLGHTLVAGEPQHGALLQAPNVDASSRALTSAPPLRTLEFATAEQAAKFATLMAVKRLRAEPGVLAADPNYLLQPFRAPNDPLYGTQWHFAQINLPQAWDVTTGSDQVVVAVIDTGVLVDHPDLQDKLVGGYDFIRDPDSAGDGERLSAQTGDLDANPNDPGDRGSVTGSSFHGTHTSGTVAAASDNGVGVSGIAWAAKVMPLRALGRAGGTEFDAQEALRFAAGLPNTSGTVPVKRADVVNMSFGGPRFSQTMANLIAEVRAAGVIVVAAAGNNGNASPMYPAAYNGVISVSAVDFDRNRAVYSNFGPTVDVAGPGGDTRRDRNGDGVGDGVLSTGGSDSAGSIQFRYPIFQGTSMASPHVAGVIALMKSVYSGLTPAHVDDLLAEGRITQDIGAAGRDDQFGYGLIDALKAVREASALAGDGGQLPADPQLIVQPTGLNFGTALTSAQIAVSNGGGGQITLTAVETNQPWLSVQPSSIDGNGLGTYNVKVDRAGLAPGTYTGTIQLASSANSVALSVIMQVSGEQNASSDAGLHYVVLYEPARHRVVSQTTAQAQNGVYSFTLTNAPPGVYHVFAGTDSNQDGFLCDPGEACGAFTTLAQPTIVVVDGPDVNGLDFTTNFVLELTGTPLAAPLSLAPAEVIVP